MEKVRFVALDVANMAAEGVRLMFAPFLVNPIDVVRAKKNFKNIVRQTISRQNRRHSRDEITLKCYSLLADLSTSSLLEYQFIAAEKHRALRKAMARFSSEVDNPEVRARANELTLCLNEKFFETSRQHFIVLSKYFERRHVFGPRMALKGYFRTNTPLEVVTIFRDRKVEYNSDASIEKNTGFHDILKTGKTYLNNNIPKSFSEGTYVNPRLKPLDACRLKWSQSRSPKDNYLSSVSAEWDSCWVDGSGYEVDHLSHYRSTLIAPLTLSSSEMADEFMSAAKEKAGRSVERRIFGFLCLDQISVDYFDNNQDVRFVEQVAKSLGALAFQRLLYTDFSETYAKVKHLLSESYEFEKHVAEKKYFSRASSKRTPENSDHLNEKVELLPSDDSLLKFARRNVRNRM